MKDKKDCKLGDSFYNTKDNQWYYFNGLNWVLPLVFRYRNYRGVGSERTVLPISLYFGVTEFYTKPCWLMHSFDTEKKQYRDFRMSDLVRET